MPEQVGLDKKISISGHGKTLARCPEHDASLPSGSNSYTCGCLVIYEPIEKETKASTQNNHPTVKSINLMKYLLSLITPTNGTVLDPFCGSGSTLVAAIYEHYHYIGIEQDGSYCAIARARVAYAEKGMEGMRNEQNKAAT